LDDGVFTPGPQLPAPKLHHCQVTAASNTIFLTSGYASNATFMLDWTTQEWTALDDITASIGGAGCGLLNNPINGAGSNLFSLTDLTWREGPALPLDISLVASVQLEDGFMMLGGMDEDREDVGSVIAINSNYEWLTNVNGWVSGRYIAGVKVPDDFLN